MCLLQLSLVQSAYCQGDRKHGPALPVPDTFSTVSYDQWTQQPQSENTSCVKAGSGSTGYSPVKQARQK